MPFKPTQNDHTYTNIGKEQRIGDRTICIADEFLGFTKEGHVRQRKVLLDAETMNEIEMPFRLDAEHVLHLGEDGSYRIHKVVE